MAKGVVLLAEVTLAELQLQPNHPAPRCTSVRGCESFHSPRLKAKPEARKPTEGYNAYIRVVKVSIPLFIHENVLWKKNIKLLINLLYIHPHQGHRLGLV